MQAVWRLVETGFGAADWNMAVDEAILEAHRQGLAPPTLRLYRWEKPTISLGYGQAAKLAADSPFNRAAFLAAGLDLVRRPTGGRAVLHANDFTYALVASGLPSSVTDAYRVLSAGLVDGLRLLGLDAQMMTGGASCRRSPDCFAAVTRSDLTVNGHKVVGSAQTRRAGAVLQHGSLYLSQPDPALAAWMPERADLADLGSLSGKPITWEAARDALVAGVSNSMAVTLEPAPLSPWEMDFAQARLTFAPLNYLLTS